MFDYTIHPEADNEIFLGTCEKLEKAVIDLIKSEPLIDVDGSIYQKYNAGNKEITVYNDYEVGAIYIKSAIDLDQYFN